MSAPSVCLENHRPASEARDVHDVLVEATSETASSGGFFHQSVVTPRFLAGATMRALAGKCTILVANSQEGPVKAVAAAVRAHKSLVGALFGTP